MNRERVVWLVVGVSVALFCTTLLGTAGLMAYRTLDLQRSDSVPANSPEDPPAEKIDNPAKWKEAAERYNSTYKPLEPRLADRYTLVYLSEDLPSKLYAEKEYNFVEERLSAKLSEISDPWAAYEYSRIISEVGSLNYKFDPEDARELLRRWTDRHPESHIAWLVRGAFNIDYAWYWRGSGYANTVSNKAWNRFSEAMQVAFDCLQKSAEINSADPEIYANLLSIAHATSLSGDEFESYYRRTLELVPSHVGVRRTKLSRLLPQWGGSWGQVDAFVHECGKAMQDLGNPLPGFARLRAYSYMESYRDGFEDIMERPEVVEERFDFYRQLAEKWPDELETRANYCRMLYTRDQYLDAFEQFEFLGDRYPVPSLWDSLSSFNYCRAFATQKYAESLVDRDQRIANFRRAIDLEPRGDYYFKLAFEYRKVADYETTESLYRSGIELEPEEENNWLGLAGLYAQLTRWEDVTRLAEASRVYKLGEKPRAKLDEMEARALKELGR